MSTNNSNTSDKNVRYKIRGGYPVEGEIKCMGAKNLATKVMIAAMLSKEKTILHNVPHIGDIEITIFLMESLGVSIKWVGETSIEIDPSNITSEIARLPNISSNRITILLVSILLHRMGRAVVPTVGGDNIGKRKVDFHTVAMESFGVSIHEEGDNYVAAIRDNHINAAHIRLPYPSVGATENCIFLGVLAKGTTIIHNVAMEPEISELITMLRSMGAIIFMNVNREITIQGVESLSGTNFTIIGDRIEIASWASLACASQGSITVKGVRFDTFSNFLPYYTLVGGGYTFIDSDTIVFYRKSKDVKHITIETDVYPGFATDWQQPFCALLTQADGISVIHETVYDRRFGYLDIFNKMNAKTQVITKCLGSIGCRYHGHDYGHTALIYGPTQLIKADEPIVVPDLRAGLAYLIISVLASGESILDSADKMERGYGNLAVRMKGTNIEIERM